MLQTLLMLSFSGGMTSVWLTACVGPIATAGRRMLRGRSGAGAAFSLALGAAALWTLVLAAPWMLLFFLAPAEAVRLAAAINHAVDGAILGLGAWLFVAGIRRTLPRFNDDIEIAAALALVALVRSDEETMSRTERIYEAHAVAPHAAEGLSAHPAGVAI